MPQFHLVLSERGRVLVAALTRAINAVRRAHDDWDPRRTGSIVAAQSMDEIVAGAEEVICYVLAGALSIPTHATCFALRDKRRRQFTVTTWRYYKNVPFSFLSRASTAVLTRDIDIAIILSVRLSVCLYVCHVSVLYLNGLTHHHAFLSIMVAKSF